MAGGSAGIILLNNTAVGNTLNGLLKTEIIMNQVTFPFNKYIAKYNIGDFIPKDQGGKFIQMEILKTEDDEEIVKKIREGILEEIFGNPIAWERFENIELEKSVWLNRFYYLPSFARMYFLSGESSFVDDMMTFIENWIKDNPRLADSHDRTYNWRDMQVAWRSIHWSWCYFLTEKALTKKQKKLIEESLREHAEILLSGFGKQRLNEFNHQSHGALAMLYLGILFPSLEESDELISTGIKILSHHLEHAFYSDGGNVEQMFGYYPFETHIFRDAYLLCKQNNEELPENILPMLEKMANFLALTAQPDGTMPPINDSFEMPVLPTIETLNHILETDININPESSKYFPETQIGVLRSKLKNNNWYVLANPAKDIGAHSHAGRLSFTAWYKDRPLLVDSGCCSYDSIKLVEWYRTSQAHNTVIIDGKTDEATSSDKLWVARRNTENKIQEWKDNGSFTFCSMTSPASEKVNSGVLWNRNLFLLDSKFLILHDSFASTEQHSYEILLHFPPLEVCVEQQDKTIKIFEENSLVLKPANKNLISELSLENGLVSIDGEDVEAPIANYKFEGKGTVNSVILFIPQNEEFFSLKIEQEETPNGIGVALTKQNGEKIFVLMKNREAKELELWGYKTQKSFDIF